MKQVDPVQVSQPPLKARPDLPAQTGLRGMAAFTVFIAHGEFYRLFPQYPVVARFYNVFLWHNVAVDLFFVLSGFILGYVYLHRDFSWRHYSLARFARIYPVYFLALLSFLAMNFMALFKTGVLSAVTTPGTVLTNFLLIQNWPLLPRFYSLNQPSWSISVEVFLYIFIFPFLLFLQKFVHPIGRMLLAVLPVVAFSVMLNFGQLPPADDLSWISGILCFVSGFFMCTLGLETRFPALPRWVEVVVLLLVFSSLLFEFPLNRGYSLIGFPFLAYITASADSLVTRILAVPILLWLGDLSYSVYIWHWCTLKAWGVLFGFREVGGMHPGTPHSIVSLCISVLLLIGGTLLLAHVSHYYFEMPFAKWLRGRKKDS